MRGEVYRLRVARDVRGQQQGARYVVVVQSDQFPLSNWLVAPTSTSSNPASFRPEVEIDGRATRVLAEQTAAVDPSRLGASVQQPIGSGTTAWRVPLRRPMWAPAHRSSLGQWDDDS